MHVYKIRTRNGKTLFQLPPGYDPFGVLARKRAGVKALVQAVQESDAQEFRKTLSAYIHDGDILQSAFRRIARLSPPPRKFQRAIVHLMNEHGDLLRQEVGNDLVLCDALRVLLPPYKGSRSLRLYRGERAINRKRRTYGLAWSRSREVAECFAQGSLQRTCDGGTVLLETNAPPRAIIGSIDSWRNEDEVIVDRRYLDRVRVLARYPQKPLIAIGGPSALRPPAESTKQEEKTGTDADEKQRK